jgi:hypothetical protein
VEDDLGSRGIKERYSPALGAPVRCLAGISMVAQNHGRARAAQEVNRFFTKTERPFSKAAEGRSDPG